LEIQRNENQDEFRTYELTLGKSLNKDLRVYFIEVTFAGKTPLKITSGVGSQCQGIILFSLRTKASWKLPEINAHENSLSITSSSFSLSKRPMTLQVKIRPNYDETKVPALVFLIFFVK